MDCACLCGINGKFPAWQSMSYPACMWMEGRGGTELVGVIYISASHCVCGPPSRGTLSPKRCSTLNINIHSEIIIKYTLFSPLSPYFSLTSTHASFVYHNWKDITFHFHYSLKILEIPFLAYLLICLKCWIVRLKNKWMPYSIRGIDWKWSWLSASVCV